MAAKRQPEVEHLSLFDAAAEATRPHCPEDPTPPQRADRVRLRLVVAYDGTDFHGLAPQPGERTVSGTLTSALATILREDVDASLAMSGRTDAGVHGWGQVLHIDVSGAHDLSPAGLAKMQRSLNKLSGSSIVVRAIDVAPDGFDARHSALWRRYRYHVLTTEVADPFLVRTAWHVPAKLDLSLMRLACDPLLGQHDFSSFCRVPRGQKRYSMVRTVTEALWIDQSAVHDGLLRFEIQAGSFCQQMVRSIVGLMVDIGRGRRHPGEVLGIIAARDRGAASPIAPPQGLILWEVGYPESLAPR